jgi:hypothetical protein
MSKMQSAFASLAIVSVVIACGGDDDGPPATQTTPTVIGAAACGQLRSECVSEHVGRTCVGEANAGWIYFSCGDTQQCDDGECVASTGPCTVGTTRCSTLSSVEACLLDGNEATWQSFSCRPDQTCDEGVCIAADAGTGG